MRCCLYLKCSLSRLSVDYNCCQFCRKRNSKQIFEFLCSLELKTIGLQESSLNHPATPLYMYIRLCLRWLDQCYDHSTNSNNSTRSVSYVGYLSDNTLMPIKIHK